MPRGEIRWEDLPASVRHRIQDHRDEERARAIPTVPGQKLWRCCSCGEILRSWAAAERHVDEQRHHRIECIVAKVDAAGGE